VSTRTELITTIRDRLVSEEAESPNRVEGLDIPISDDHGTYWDADINHSLKWIEWQDLCEEFGIKTNFNSAKSAKIQSISSETELDVLSWIRELQEKD
jgi:hypothetical protein